MIYYDAHSHRPNSDPGIVAVLDRSAMELTMPEPPGRWLSSCGIHPWRTGTGLDLPSAVDDIERLAAAGRLAAVGECGLDRLRGASLGSQDLALRPQLELARRHDLPVVIHCVRARPELLRVRRDFPDQPWLVHGCRDGVAGMRAWLDAGCVLSFGHALCDSARLRRDFAAIVPPDRFLLETDDSGADIRLVYAAAASARNLAPDSLAARVAATFHAFFGFKTA